MDLKVIGRIIFDKVQANAPELLIGAGITTMGIAAVKACKATAEDGAPVLIDAKTNLDWIKDEYKDDEKEKKSRILTVYKGTAIDLTKIYLPSVITFCMGASMVLASHHIMTGRNVALATAYQTVNSAFEEYRENVRKTFGEEVDNKLLTGSEDIEYEILEDKGDGKKPKHKKVKETVANENAKGRGYLRYLTPTSGYWVDDPIGMELFLRSEQNTANDLFKIYKSYTLDDVWKRLGFAPNPLSSEELKMGWCEGVGDQFINFNVQKVKLPNDDGTYIDAYAIDPNVQCNVIASINKKRIKALNDQEA